MRVSRDTSLIKPEVARVRGTSHRQQNMTADYFGWTCIAIDADRNLTVAFRQRDILRVQPHLYSFGFQNFAHGIRYVFVFASDQTRAHLDDRDLTAEPSIHLREFEPDVTAA